jgi:hypothetical protein
MALTEMVGAFFMIWRKDLFIKMKSFNATHEHCAGIVIYFEEFWL